MKSLFAKQETQTAFIHPFRCNHANERCQDSQDRAENEFQQCRMMSKHPAAEPLHGYESDDEIMQHIDFKCVCSYGIDNILALIDIPPPRSDNQALLMQSQRG